MEELYKLRSEIDRIDFELLKLLKTRMETALKIRKFKTEITDTLREIEVLNRVKSSAQALGLLTPEFAGQMFSQIIEASKTLQAQGYRLIGFQGEHGAYSEVAARAYHSGLAYIPCREFADVFESVKQGYLDLGIVPVENSLGGAVTQVNELLIQYDLPVIAEIKIPIHHCLLALPGTDHRDIRVVYSHPQALMQCRNFLQRNHLEPRPYYDTAGAAKMLSTERPDTAAALASKLCAELYNLEIIKEGVEDHEANVTRFLVLDRQPQQEPGAKCSIIFCMSRETATQSGSLYGILKLFADAKINLTRIESMPNRNDPGNYYFFLDFEGNDADETVKRVLDGVKNTTVLYKFLGCYKEVSPS